MERYCNVLLVFAFNSPKYETDLMKSYLLPLLVNEWRIETMVIKQANHFLLFKSGVIQLSHLLNFLGIDTNLDSLLKDYKTSETESFFPYEWSDKPENYHNSFSSLQSFLQLTEQHISPSIHFSRFWKFNRRRLDIWKSSIETKIEATTCNWTTGLNNRPLKIKFIDSLKICFNTCELQTIFVFVSCSVMIF